jgi:hypothetical protein
MGDPVDRAALRKTLRLMERGELLRVAERAVDGASAETLQILIGDFMKIPFVTDADPVGPGLLDEVQRFYAAALRGEFHESFDVNWKNCTQFSRGTDGFIAEFDCLINRCISEASVTPTVVRESFERLFDLLRQVDEDPDRIVFFADEAGAWQIPVDWMRVLAAYFQVLALDSSAPDFAGTVDEMIEKHCDYRRPDLLAAARAVANTAQLTALTALPIVTARR